MKALPLPLKTFLSLVLIVAVAILTLQAYRDVAITSDSISTDPVDGQDHSALNRSDGTASTPLTTSHASQHRHLSKMSSNIGERELLDNTKIHSFLRDGASATQKQKDDTASGVDTVPARDASLQDGLVEVECNGETSTFTTEVLLEAAGDPSLVSQSDVLALQSTFVTVYNNIASMFCDDQQRVLLNATIVEIIIDDDDGDGGTSPPGRRSLQMQTPNDAHNDKMGYWPLQIIDATLPPSDTSRFIFRFLVNGQCSGCPPDARIYDDVTQRHLVKTVLKLITTQHQHKDLRVHLDRGLQEGDGSNNGDDKCYCPENPVAPRLPTADEFIAAFEVAVVELDLDGVQSVPEVIEQPVSSLSPSMTPQDPTLPPNTAVVPVNCSSDEGLFETEAYIGFTGTPDFIQPFEIAAVENAFPQTYNLLASVYCDVQFREVLTATVVDIVDSVPSTPTRMLQESGTANIPNGTNATNIVLQTLPPRSIFRGFYFRFVVTGRCRGCPRDASLFDDVRRMLEVQLSSIQTGARRYLQDNDNGQTEQQQEGDGANGDHQCFCPENTPAFRAPSAGEFETAFDEQVRELDLPNIQTVTNITGTPAAVTSVPSTIPTPGPTPAAAAPTRSSQGLAALIQSRLPSISFDNATSPESRALVWMTEVDTYNQDGLSDDQLVQRFAMAAIGFSISGLDNWLTDSTECSWGSFRVACNSLGEVNQIVDRWDLLSGSIPVSIGLLTNIDVLYLWSYTITGTIPTEVGKLTKLTQLYLLGDLTGTIPTEVGGLTALTTLDFYGNPLTGTIPSEVGRLTALTWLWLTGGDLTGTIPSEVWGLTELTELRLPSNALTGRIPSEVGGLTALTSLWLFNNQLTGSIASEVWGLTALELFDVALNRLTGTIPSEVEGLTALSVLGFDDNALTGTIPTQVGELTALTWLGLRRNALTGKIPSEVGRLTTLIVLDVDFNALTGRIPTEVWALTALTQMSVADNALTGTIPTEVGGLTALKWLFLYFNSLTGSIPSEVWGLTALERFDVALNRLTGTIPTEAGGLTALSALSLSGSSLTGSIPSEVGQLTALARLWLDTNALTGSIPSEVGGLTSLSALGLYSNALTGTMPMDVCGWSFPPLIDCGEIVCDCCVDFFQDQCP